MKAVILALALTMPLLGCPAGGPFTNGNSVASSAGQVSLEAEKALVVAHLAYNAVGTQLIAAANSGSLKGAAAAQAKTIYDKAGDALKVADSADKAANQTQLLQAINDANAAIAQAQTLIKGN